ncbi:hypothetical protein MAP00_003483 [Monascus purpureus]|nr:hypothetical protein MAP00_003483 [Monascus purpureus]
MWLPSSEIVSMLPSIREPLRPPSAVPSASNSRPNTSTTSQVRFIGTLHGSPPTMLPPSKWQKTADPRANLDPLSGYNRDNTFSTNVCILASSHHGKDDNLTQRID